MKITQELLKKIAIYGSQYLLDKSLICVVQYVQCNDMSPN